MIDFETREYVKNLDKRLEEMFRELPLAGDMVGELIKWFLSNEKVKGLLKQVEELLTRDKVVFLLFGRSGHGKSSLINAIAGREVAEVGHIKPTTMDVKEYEVGDRNTGYVIFLDARGILETRRWNDGESPEDMLREAVERWQPDVVLHVVKAPELRNLEEDIRRCEELMEWMKERCKIKAPLLAVLTAVDVLGNPREWPPEGYPGKMGLIRESVGYAIEIFGIGDAIPVRGGDKAYGVVSEGMVEGCRYIGVIPVCLLRGSDEWNVDVLREVIFKVISKSSWVTLAQVTKAKDKLEEVAHHVVEAFSRMAAAVGASPIPLSDIAVLTPLQSAMVCTVGALSCRRFKDALGEYLAAMGLQTLAGIGFRTAFRQLVKIFPGLGSALAAGIAYLGTKAIGESAILYFFRGVKKKPEEIKREMEERGELKEISE